MLALFAKLFTDNITYLAHAFVHDHKTLTHLKYLPKKAVLLYCMAMVFLPKLYTYLFALVHCVCGIVVLLFLHSVCACPCRVPRELRRRTTKAKPRGSIP